MSTSRKIDPEQIVFEPTGTSNVHNQKWPCPVHGATEQTIHVHIDGYEHNGSYCMLCALEKYVIPFGKIGEFE